jgi:hypothetical protein
MDEMSCANPCSTTPLMSDSGPSRSYKDGQSMSALPGISDVNLFRYRKRIIDFDAEVSDGAFDFGVA